MHQPGIRLVVAAAIAGIALTGTLIYRAHITALDRARSHQTDQVVCLHIHELVVTLEGIVLDGARPAQLKRLTYYREHPDEVAVAVASSRRTVREIRRRGDCKPADLPTTGGN